MSFLDNIGRDERALLKDMAKQELARRKYINYLEYVYPDYTRTHFNEYIAMRIDELIRKGGKRYMFFMPPRHGKSYTITKALPAYYLMHNPTHEVMLVSYGSDLSTTFGKSNRDIFGNFSPKLYGLFLNPDKKGVVSWEVKDHGGVCFSTSILGVSSGRGADLLIIDDPVKNIEDVNKVEKRDKLYENYLSAFNSRLHRPNASVVMILTRWHDDDLAGRILAESEKLKAMGEDVEEWEVISFPAIATENDILGREPGEPLWPEVFDKQNLNNIKNLVGSKIWNSLYQQSPVIEDGDIFKYDDFQRYKDTPEKFDRILQSWDTAFKDTIQSDYVVGQVWGKKGANYYMLYQIRGRFSFSQTRDLIKRTVNLYPKSEGVLIEESSNGHAIINELSKTISGIIPIRARDSKESRARAISGYVEAHNVFVPDTSVGDDIIDEATKFPSGKHDDQVDAMTQALNYFRDHDTRLKLYHKSMLGL